MSLREKHKEQRREAILNASDALLRDGSVNGISMREVARRADVSEVTPYNLFESKVGILGALLKLSIGRFNSEMAAMPEPANADPIDKIYTVAWQLVNHWTEDAAFYRSLFDELYIAR